MLIRMIDKTVKTIEIIPIVLVLLSFERIYFSPQPNPRGERKKLTE